MIWYPISIDVPKKSMEIRIKKHPNAGKTSQTWIINIDCCGIRHFRNARAEEVNGVF